MITILRIIEIIVTVTAVIRTIVHNNKWVLGLLVGFRVHHGLDFKVYASGILTQFRLRP